MPSLAVTSTGAGPRLVLLHGFTQDGTLWGPFGELLARSARLEAVDLPGHGSSASIALSLEETADALVAQLGGDAVDLLGYSLGGRVALVTALRHPASIRRLVLIGATAGITEPSAREARRALDERRALELETTGDVAGFIEDWLSQPMFARLDPRRAGAERRALNSAAGLAASLRLMGTGTMAPLWDQLGTCATPTLLLAGASDPRFTDAARRMAARMPEATFSLVPGAGHACHLEQPALTAQLVRAWLAGGDPHASATPRASSTPTAS